VLAKNKEVDIMHAVKLGPGNIWFGNRPLAVFTNPTEIAFRKGNLKRHWPVRFFGIDYPDAEAAYKDSKQPTSLSAQHARSLGLREKHSFDALQSVMTNIIIHKLRQHPVLLETLKLSGGLTFIEQCSHLVFPGCQNRLGRWEGWGLESAFIRCLHRAFKQVANEGGESNA